nr:MAG TPA: hypothetical protein [Caudoviricetes sp.]
MKNSRGRTCKKFHKMVFCIHKSVFFHRKDKDDKLPKVRFYASGPRERSTE